MDNITHTLTGLALSRAGFNRVVPQATLILLLAANAPDIDVVTALGGSLSYLNWHRDVTHSVVGVPLVAMLPVLIARLVARRPISWLACYLVSLAGAATNPLLDWTNAYGVRLLAPFSREWFQGGFTHIFDVWIWTVLGLAFVWPPLSRLVMSEIGAKATPGRGLAIFALCFVAAYNAGRYTMHERAVAVLDSRIYAGAAPLRVAAFPGAFNPFRWSGIVEGESFWSIHELNLLEEFDSTQGKTLYKPEPSPAMEAARRTPEFQQFLQFAQYVYWRLTPLDAPEGAQRVEAIDLRFGPPWAARSVATAVVLAGERVESEGVRFGAGDQRRRR
ncbi:MAG: metal-dependent hydrolase [Bryobacterales bacterium]|nr:metal-dependent hydrolase [Bryobacterales bacterium]